MYLCIFLLKLGLLGCVTILVRSSKVKNDNGDSFPPNFVFVLTDDQDLLLNSLMPMKKTLKLVADKGKFFQNAFANSPICCPSRSTIMTGKYAHNTGVVNNSLSGNCAGDNWRLQHEPESIAAILKKSANYTNFYAGKYLNKYGNNQSGGLSHIPKGYDWWIGLKGNSKYYNYTLSVNGTARSYRNVYLTDLLANFSMNFLNQKFVKTSPFFMMIAPPASHAPFIPPKRYSTKFPTMKAVRNPSFNHTPHGKHWIVRMPPDNLLKNVSILDQIHRRRLQTLLSVDDLVERVILKLKELKIYQRTYFILNSDNGYHIGQFSQPWDKRQPYETDIRVPFIISGPNVPKKTLEPFPISSVDIAPTILDLAGIRSPVTMDGKSFKKQLFKNRNSKKKKANKMVFIEYWGEGDGKSIDKSCPWSNDDSLAECTIDQWCKCQDSRNNTYTCVVDFSFKEKIKFCKFSDDESFVEAYNLSKDPYELKNIYSSMDTKKVKYYGNVISSFQKCSGKSCRKL